MIENCPARAVARSIRNTTARGPTPREVAIFKRWASDNKKRDQMEAAWSELARDYRHGEA